MLFVVLGSIVTIFGAIFAIVGIKQPWREAIIGGSIIAGFGLFMIIMAAAYLFAN